MKTGKKLTAFILAVFMVLSLCACDRTPKTDGLFEKATYKTDTTLGNGNTEITVAVKVGEDTVNFTVKTDKTTLGDALLEVGLVSGDETEYGLFIKSVNGITADYNTDGAFWSIEQNGEMLMTSADTTEISGGGKYELVYSK